MRNLFLQVVPAMVDAAPQLEDPGGDASGLRGLLDLRRGQGASPKVLHLEARQLRFSIELHQARSVGHRIRDFRRRHTPDHTQQQELVPGFARWLSGRIVSHASRVILPSYRNIGRKLKNLQLLRPLNFHKN